MKNISFLTALMVFAGVAVASDGDVKRFTATNKTWQDECGSCHLAYPPKLLPAESWKALMNSLDRHFGSDAGVETQKAKEIEDFLTANAGRRKAQGADGKPELRITRTYWFLDEHDEIPAATWKHLQVRLAANCGACHTGVERGDYSERNIHLPR